MQKLLDVTIRFCDEAQRLTKIEHLPSFKIFNPKDIPGFEIFNDRACLVSKQIYDEFSFPFEKILYDRYAPEPGNRRFYHADSEMSHHLDSLNMLDCNELNLGPTVDPKLIRKKCPNAAIVGQIPPFLLMNGTPEEVVKEVRKIFNDVGKDGGLYVSTAGSIGAGTPIENIKAMMYAVQEYCRYN